MSENTLKTVFIFESDEADRRINLARKNVFALNDDINNIGKNNVFGKTIAADFGLAGKSVDSFKNKVAGLGDAPNLKPIGGDLFKKATADVALYEKNRASLSKSSLAEIERGEKALTRIKISEAKAANNAAIGEINKRVNAEKQAQQSSLSGGSLFGSIVGGNLAARAITEISGVALSGGLAVLNYKANLEQTAIGFERLEGSGDLAFKQIERLQKFANTTPLTFAGLLPTAQRFEEIGFKGEKLIPVLTDIGNVVAGGVGKPGESLDVRLERVGLALKQTFDKNRVQTQELNQLAEAGVNGLDILSKGTGKSRAELVKLVEQGQITGDVLLKSLQKVSRAEFGSAMEKQSKTFNGALSTISDSLITVAGKSFDPLFKKISSLSVEIAREVNKGDKDLRQIGATIANSIAKGFGEILSDSIKNELNTATKNVREGKSSGLFSLFNANVNTGGSLYEGTIGKSIPELIGSSYRLSRQEKFDSGFNLGDLQDLKDINFFGKFDAEIKILEEEKQKKTRQLIDAITFRGDDFSPLKQKGQFVQIVSNGISKQAQELSDLTNKFKLSNVDNYFDYKKSRISIESNGDSFKAIRENSQLEQQSLTEKIRLQKQYFDLQARSLSPEDLAGDKGTKLAFEATGTVQKLEYQKEIARLNSRKQLNEEAKKLKDEFRDTFVSLKSNDNPLVKTMSDIETATERAQKRFGAFGDDVVNKIAAIERANLSKAINLQKFENNFGALKFDQDARKLAATPDRQFADFARKLELVNRRVEFVSTTNDLTRKISEADFYANKFNPNNPKSFAEFNRRGGNDDISDAGIQIRSAVSDIRDLKNIGLEGTGPGGKEAVINKILDSIPPRDELLKRLNSPLGGDSQSLLEDQANALRIKKDIERNKFNNFLEDQRTAEFGKVFAREQIGLINGSGLSDKEKAQQRLSVTNALGNDLDPALKRQAIQDSVASANEKRSQDKESLQTIKDLKDLVAGLVKQLTEKGIKTDAPPAQVNLTLNGVDATVSENQLPPAATSADTDAAYSGLSFFDENEIRQTVRGNR